MKNPPPWWEMQRRHLVSRPSDDGLRKLAGSVSRGSRCIRIRRLRGGLGTATHVITLERRSGRTFDVVIKRFRRDQADVAREEWAKTVYAHRLPVTSPEPIAYEERDWFGMPVIVISKLDGGPELAFDEPERWYEQIVDAMLAIGSVSTTRLPAAVRGRVPGREFDIPGGLRRTPLVLAAFEEAKRLAPRALRQELVIGHGDLHPGNMLWSRGRLTGLVDWSSCNLQFPTRELVYCRTELAVLFGAREADSLVGVYERRSGRVVEHLRFWDLLQGLTAMRWVPWWAHGYREQGRTDLTEAVAKRRAIAVVRRAVAAR